MFEATVSNILLGVLISIVCLVLISKLLALSGTPGPWGIPVLGYYPFLMQDYHIQLHDLAKKYGPVYLINIVGQDYLYLDTIQAIREAHVNQSDVFYSRTNDHVLFSLAFKDGLIDLNGEAWKHMRKFFTQNMRDIGLVLSNKDVKGPIEDSVQSTLDILTKSKGQIDLIQVLTDECTKPFLKLFLGDVVSEKDAININRAYIEVAKPMTDTSILLNGSTAKRFIFPFVRGQNEMLIALKEMRRLLKKVIDDHKSTFDPDQPPRDFIDRYLCEKALREKKGDSSAAYFTDESLLGTLIQAYGDGSTGIGIFAAFVLKNISYYRKVQDDIYEEIIRVVGTERLPTVEDRVNLPLTVSTIKEVLRTSHYFPIIPGLECSRDTTVLGVKASKGCKTLVNYYAAHHDPEVYTNPYEFDSTRFFPEKTKVEPIITFGLGKRSCLGEGLVMAELFLFFASVLQHFIVCPPTENEKLTQGLQDIHEEKFPVRLQLRVHRKNSTS